MSNGETDMTTKAFPVLQAAFPDFDVSSLPTIPAGWKESSFHNDACPSFTVAEKDGSFLMVYVDYPNKEEREWPMEARFCILISNVDVTDSFDTNDWSEILAKADEWAAKL